MAGEQSAESADIEDIIVEAKVLRVEFVDIALYILSVLVFFIFARKVIRKLFALGGKALHQE